MWLLVGVNDLVATESGGLSEPLATHFTDEGPGAGVDRHVPRQVVVGVEYFATVRAGVGLVLALHHGLHLGVHGEARGGGGGGGGAVLVAGGGREGGEGEALGREVCLLG